MAQKCRFPQNFDMTALYDNWIRTMSDLQETGAGKRILL